MKKLKVYEYNFEGELVRTHDSILECSKKISGSDKPRNIFQMNKTFYIDRNKKLVYCTNELTKVNVQRIVWTNCNILSIDDNSENIEIEMLNIDGVVIATFANMNIASKITKISYQTIYSSVKNSKSKKILKNENRVSFREKKV